MIKIKSKNNTNSININGKIYKTDKDNIIKIDAIYFEDFKSHGFELFIEEEKIVDKSLKKA